MTEVRKLLNNDDDSQCGFFATRRYEEGEEILGESIPWKLQPSPEQEALFTANFVNDAQWNANERSKLNCMLSAILTFIKTPESDRKWLLELYHPKKESMNPMEQDISRLAKGILEWLDTTQEGDQQQQSSLRDERQSLHDIAMVWACNSFAGGRIYQRHSRLNHSCRPNAIVQTNNDSDEQWIRAIKTIETGDEINISYLPIEFLYSETQFRRRFLKNTKYFECHCPSCLSPEQPVMSVPCIKCHKRQGILEEDVQYDDDQAVRYAWVRTADGTYRCASCDRTFSKEASDRALRTHRTVVEKISAFLETYQHQDSDDSGTLMEYTSLSSSVNGALHWTTNILLYYQLDSALQDYHKRLIGDTTLEPDMDQIAEFIDMLQRLCRFVKHSGVSLHRGHWLGDVIIGTARALVALGDVKSQKYAAEWLTEEDFDSFVKRYEPEHLQKVVDRLRSAWSQNDGGDVSDDLTGGSGNKRMKTDS